MTKYDILKRTRQLNIDIIIECNQLPKTTAAFELGKQIIRSSSSIGANYRALQRAKSDSDFINKYKIIIEEADETIYWLDIMSAVGLLNIEKATSLMKEANELTSIFVASLKKFITNINLKNSL